MRFFSALFVVLVACFVSLSCGAASASAVARSASDGLVGWQAALAVIAPCPAQGDVSSCDADGDGIPDTVERVVCGTATCATGREDTDKDGVPDWTGVMACGSVTCASSAKDSVGDGVPDYARQSATADQRHEASPWVLIIGGGIVLAVFVSLIVFRRRLGPFLVREQRQMYPRYKTSGRRNSPGMLLFVGVVGTLFSIIALAVGIGKLVG